MYKMYKIQKVMQNENETSHRNLIIVSNRYVFKVVILISYVLNIGISSFMLKALMLMINKVAGDA